MSAASAKPALHEITLLLRLLRPAASADFEWPPVAGWDWRAFATACDHHDVASFVYCRLRSLSWLAVPPGLLEHLRLRFLEISGRNYHLARNLIELTSLLEDHQIPVLAYKGPALAIAAYGDLALRQYHDLDLVIRREHLQKAVGVMTRSGFEITPTMWNPCQPENPRYVARHPEIPFLAPDKSHFVDLHWQLAHQEAQAFRLDVAKVWNRAERVKLLQSDISTLCREDLFLTLCCHGTVHRWARLKWLLDIAELLRDVETLNWTRIQEMTGNAPFTRASASLAVLLARELLEIEVPDQLAQILPATKRTRAVAAAVRHDILLRGYSNVNALSGLLEGSPLERMKYFGVQSASMFDQVFAQVSPKERALVHLPEWLNFLYHFIRPTRLLFKHSRRVARSLLVDGRRLR